MKRKYLVFLQEWLRAHDRQPLVIRGARQVGKTWLVRYFAKQQNRRLIELNFEKEPQLVSFFKSNDPNQILLNLGSFFGEVIHPDQCLLFLDEIQAVPELLAKLRWFAEDLPEIPVIAAGSLLEFVLEEHTFSMPVGRIGYMHMEPLSFEEFLVANKQESLSSYIEAFQWNTEIPEALHEKLLSSFKEYIVIGGMPAAVASWVVDRALPKAGRLQS